MISQGELEQIPLPFQKHMSELEVRIMTDLINRLKANREITSTADWQINRLRQLGLSNDYIKQQIRDVLELTDADINKLYEDAVKESYIRNKDIYQKHGKNFIPFEENRELQGLLEAVRKQTSDEFHNITGSFGFAIRGPDGKIIQTPLKKFYQDTLDAAMMDIGTGAFDYNTVLKRTIQTLTNSGLRTIDYNSGRSYRVEVAARMCVMTGFNQVQAKMNEQVAKDLDTEYFEVSWHGGARPSHQVWQGKVYSRRELGSVCGLGSAGGLCGVNCYHNYDAFIPGTSVRTYTDSQLDEMNRQENELKSYDGKEYTTYEALQEQRRLERLMRKQRQDIKLFQSGEGDKGDILAAQSRYRITTDDYAKFSRAMKLPQQKDRIFQDGLGNRGFGLNNVVKREDDGIIKEKKMYRKKGKAASELMPKKQLQRIVKSFKRRGGTIQMNEATDAYLDLKKAEAITYDSKTILLRQKPSRAAVFEELIHAAQYRKGKNDGSLQSRLLCEIEAQEKLLKYQKAYRLTESEIRQTEKALEKYQEELAGLSGKER